MATELQTDIEKQYSLPNLENRVFSALQKVKNGNKNFSRNDFTGFDEFHIQGIKATRELATLLEIQPNMTILDIGCGVGGPARTLASEYNAQVVGIDAVKQFSELATKLSKLVQLSDRTQFMFGSALALPFSDTSFDIVWMQHMNMNFKEKDRLYAEASRVLRSGGKVALYEICKGKNTNEPLSFPVPWANTETMNYLIRPEEIVEMLHKQGLKSIVVKDVTQECLQWFTNVLEAIKKGKLNPLGLHLVSGDDFKVKAENIVINIKEEKIEVLLGIFG